MKKRSLLAAAVTLVAIFIFAMSAQAQCRFPACDRDGERYNRATEDCESGPDPLTRALSHRVPTCRDDERFDRATGECVLRECDEGCEARRLCSAKERYARSGRDREGVYGVCNHSSGLNYRSHRLVRCASGFTLNERRGACVRCPVRVPVEVRLPDLVIRRAFLRVASSPSEITRLRVGTPYLACFEVANLGTRESGPFRVSGGGLGVRIVPTQDHASLLPGAVREGCLSYSTTPPVGSYRLGITADSLSTVREIRERNNGATLVLEVTPK